MKVWVGHGSEHSYRLVLIGHFRSEEKARAAKQKYDQIVESVFEIDEANWDAVDDRFPDELMALVKKLEIYNMSRSDFDGFRYDFTLDQDGADLTITGQDIEVQGFIKLFIDHGAKIELFSGDDWTAEDKG